MKEKILWIGLIIVIVSWIGNYFYFQSKQLEQPIFLDHYYETYIQDETNLTFYYLSNKIDHSEVSSIFLDGVEAYPVSNDGFSMWESNTPRFEQEFSHQYLKSVRLELPTSRIPIEERSEDVWFFEEISVTFSNGQTITSDIGNVKVYGKLPDYEVFETRVSSSSNQHRSEEFMVATKSLTVEAITVPFASEIAEDVYVVVDVSQEKLKDVEAITKEGYAPDWFEEHWDELDGISINEGLFPFHLDTNDSLQLSMQFNPNRKSYYRFGVAIVGTTDEGEPFIRQAPIIDHPYLTQQDIDEIIAEKQGGVVNEPSF